MTRSVLVATPHPTFGELLRLSLEENGDYQVSQVETGQQALAATNGKVLALAILDSDLADLPFNDLVQSLHAQHPGMRLIVIPPENDHAHPSLVEIKPDACLSRPFYLPDMLYTVKKVLSTSDVMAEEKKLPDKPATFPAFASYAWQTDADQAARQLAEVLVDSSAHAALMMKDGQIWAYTGSLDRVASLEIATILARYLDNAEKSDLARFVRLNSTKIEYMVYATALVDDLVLALIFDASTPLTRIRSQVIRLARSLKQTETQAKPAPTSPAPADGEKFRSKAGMFSTSLTPDSNIVLPEKTTTKLSSRKAHRSAWLNCWLTCPPRTRPPKGRPWRIGCSTPTPAKRPR